MPRKLEKVVDCILMLVAKIETGPYIKLGKHLVIKI